MCNRTSWDALWEAHDRQSRRPHIKIDLQAARDLLACHEKQMSGRLLLEEDKLPLKNEGRKYAEVDRLRLFRFLQAHGDVCRSAVEIKKGGE